MGKQREQSREIITKLYPELSYWDRELAIRALTEILYVVDIDNDNE